MKKRGNFRCCGGVFSAKGEVLEKKCKKAVRKFVHHEEKLKKYEKRQKCRLQT